MIVNRDSTLGRKLDLLRGRSQAYRRALLNPFGHEVLRDLAPFCRAFDTTFHADPRVHAALEGRREVWLRVQRHLRLSVEDQLRIFDAKSFPTLQESE